MKKIKMNQAATIAETFKDFLTSRKVKGLADKTIETYEYHLHAISKHFDIGLDIGTLKKRDIENLISSLRESGLASNTIRSYTRTFKSFFSWCNEEGISTLNLPLYKAEETIKETYSDNELKTLLKKPDVRKCILAEFRNWTIINFRLK
jgi:integrase/recombinase XerD